MNEKHNCMFSLIQEKPFRLRLSSMTEKETAIKIYLAVPSQ